MNFNLRNKENVYVTLYLNSIHISKFHAQPSSSDRYVNVVRPLGVTKGLIIFFFSFVRKFKIYYLNT